MRIRLLAVLAALAATAVMTFGVAAVRGATVGATVGPAPPRTAPASQAPASRQPASSVPAPSVPAPGVKPPGQIPATVAGVVSANLPRFDTQCGCRPDVAVHYVRWGESPAESVALARAMLAAGAVPMLEIEPFSITLASVTSGRGDQWLTAYAHAVAALKAPVLLSFAPEANGGWYPWGWTHASPATEVAAWRHVVRVFRSAGVTAKTGARWVWIVNRLFNGSGPLAQLWPGPAWADEIGIDGYFRDPAETFTAVFASTISQARNLAKGAALLISETGATPQAGKVRAIQALTAGISRYRLSGFVWFDINQGTSDPSHGNWAVTGDPAALAAYRKAVEAG